ncbi:MAG: hypothetical protein RIS47_1558 [Bacteroidota bacterium]
MRVGIFKILQIGITPDTPATEARRIYFSNSLFVLVFILFFVVNVIEYYYLWLGLRDLFHTFFRLTILIILPFFLFWLNYQRLYTAARVLLMLGTPLILLIIPTISGNVIDEYFFWYPYAPTSFSVTIYMLFDVKKQIRIISGLVLFYLLLTLFIDSLLLNFGPNSCEVIPIVKANYVYYKLSAFLAFALTNIVLFLSARQIHYYEAKLELANSNLLERNALIDSQLVKLEKLVATKDRLFRIIGHDLKNPFGTIIGFMNLLEGHGSKISEDRMKVIISALKETSQDGYKLLEDLLEWSRCQTGDLTVNIRCLDLRLLVADTLAFNHHFAEGKNIRLINEIEQNHKVWADEKMLRTILRNLISNAIKFTRVNGKIEISSTLKDTHIVISVRDTGVGIAPDLVDRIFDLNEFHSSMGTAQEKGNGLGLVICREFVDMQKGKIWVDLSTNEGTKIDFSLPNCNSLPNDETKTDLSPNISATTNQFVW